MRAVFLSHNRSDAADAYNYRLRMLARHLSAEGIDSRMVYLGDPPLGNPTILHPLKVRGAFGEAGAIVHAGSAACAFTASWLSRRKAPYRVFDMHGDTVAEQRLAAAANSGWKSALRVSQERWKERRGLRAADRVLVVSEPLREHVLSSGLVNPEQIWMVRNGVDLDRFRETEPYPAREIPRLLYAGRFDPWQGLEFLEELIRARDDSFELRIIGFEPGDASLRGEWGGIGNPQLTMKGRLTQEELVRELSRADALLLPRADDPVTRVAMPTKFAEYLSVGRPILLTDVGEPARFVRESGCGMVSAPTPHDFGALVRQFTKRPASERAEMAKPGPELAKRHFDWDTIGREYASRLREAFGTDGLV
ncbi:MAG: glycosyltransferase [Gemmatimonadetes bacterium]|nr:glycosyltransferase [Gemmatimonadota bacterium]